VTAFAGLSMAALAFSAAAWATLPGANGRIAYALGATIHTILPNGTHDRTLTSGEGPSWSPNGRRIAFSRTVGQPPSTSSELFTMRANGSELRRVTHDPLLDGDPSYSPSGRRIAFVGEGASGNDMIFSIRTDGSHRRRLTAGESPVYSPTGRWIAFQGGATGIYVMRPDGSHLHPLTNAPRGTSDDAPDYSPNGRLIAFTRSFENTAVAFTVPAAGGRVKRLGSCAAIAPSFSPDGQYLASEANRTRGLVISPADGTCPATTLVPYDAFAPSWQPAAEALARPSSDRESRALTATATLLLCAKSRSVARRLSP
jgi:Tol biopolymer transport system component